MPQGLHAELSDRPAPLVGSEPFTGWIAAATGARLGRGGVIRLLPDGKAFYDRLLEAVGAARSSAHVMAYGWEGGEVGRALSEALARRARAGVEVRVLVDTLPSVPRSDPQLEAIRAAGGRVALFGLGRASVFRPFAPRAHRRAFVIDGRRAFTGGMGIADKWRGGDEPGWYDAMFEVTGPLAAEVQGAFAGPWREKTGEAIDGGRYLPPAGDDGPAFVSLLGPPASGTESLRALVARTFEAARERLFVSSSYFLADDGPREILAARARAGVDVRLLLPGPRTNSPWLRKASQRSYAELLAAGVRIFEYQPSMLHAKLVVADGGWSVLGSANMDERSWGVNLEHVLGVQDTTLAFAIEGFLWRAFERSVEITSEAWRRRGVGARLFERAAGLFRPWY